MLFKQAVECSSDAIAITNSHFKHFYQNRAFADMYECETVKEFNQDFGGLRSAYVDPQVARSVVKAISRGKNWIGEVEQRSKTGRITPVLLRASTIYNSKGKIIGAIGSHTDISEQKRAEASLKRSEAQLRQQAADLQQALAELGQTQAQLVQSEKMSSLGQLVAGIAHEINNPVNFIYGNIQPAYEYIQDLLNLIELYQDQYPNPTAQVQEALEEVDIPFVAEDLPKLLQSMEVGAERIRIIVNSLRTFSRMDEAEMKAVDLHEGIESSLMIVEHRLKANDDRRAINLIKDYRSLPQVDCYAGQINQVFMNLLLNGIDAIDDRAQQHPNAVDYQPQIRICTEMARFEQTDSEQITIRFIDNGPGISETIKSRLFDPFFTTKPVGKGTGMGLSISYQIITEQHGGTLQCISAPGQGAEFVITIPLAPKAL